MIKTELSWTRDKIKFYGAKWAPETAPKGIICLVHGHGEHLGRYEYFASQLTASDYAVIALDLRGHGKSTGKRGHTPTYEALMADLDEFMTQTAKEFPDLPVFLYGHSMGGNLAANYVIRRNPLIKGCIVTGAWFRLATKPSGFMILLGRIMNVIWPSFSQKSKLNTKHLSRDRDIVTAYENDPLVHSKISARLAMSMMDAGEFAIAHAQKIVLPILAMHGGADEITSADATRDFVKKASHSDIQQNIFKGFFHEIHNEPEKDQVFKVLTGWLSVHN